MAVVFMQSAAVGGERRGQRWYDGGGFALQSLVCQRKYIFRKVFAQARPGKGVGHGSGGAGGITTQ